MKDEKREALRVFVATGKTQGQRGNDFCWTQDGELVGPPMFVCEGELPDGRCGCNRSLTGFKSGKGTTTALVVEFPGTEREYRWAIRDWMLSSGWAQVLPENERESDSEQYISATAAFLLRQAARFAVGTVVEYRAGSFAARRVKEREREGTA